MWIFSRLKITSRFDWLIYGGMPMKILWAALDVLTIIVLVSGIYLWIVRRKAGKA